MMWWALVMQQLNSLAATTLLVAGAAQTATIGGAAEATTFGWIGTTVPHLSTSPADRLLDFAAGTGRTETAGVSWTLQSGFSTPLMITMKPNELLRTACRGIS